MSGPNWLQLVALVAAIGLTAPFLAAYLARVLGGGAAPGDRCFAPVERLVYRAAGVDPEREQPWNVYALSLLAFSAVSIVGLYVLERLQGGLPLNPTAVDGVPGALAFNTAASFVTNTNWQNYAGESTMSHLTQMGGLAVQNFVSAAVGIAVAVALVRGLTRRRSQTIGNFWVDLTRITLRVLVPLATVLALVLASQGVVQSLRGPAEARTVEGGVQSIYRAPIASQEAIKELGTNGGGIANANSAHPFENPTGLTNLLEMWALLVLPFALALAFGRLVGDRRQGWALFAAMFVLWLGSGPAEDLQIGETVITGMRAIESDESCRLFELIRPSYVSYSVRNESYCTMDESGEVGGPAVQRVFEVALPGVRVAGHVRR